MNGYLAIVADGARARFMALERSADAPARAALRLVESGRLTNPEHTVSGRRDARKIKSGRDTAQHGTTDHRAPHDAELMRRFAARIGKRAAVLAAKNKLSTVVLVADARMLGLLRAALEPVAKSGVAVRKLAHDYTWCRAPELKRHLAENGLI